MDYMAEWYRDWRSAILLLQSVVGMLLVSYRLKRRDAFLPRLCLSTALGCLLMFFIGNRLYIRGYTALAILSHVTVPLLAFLLLAAVTYISFEESVWTVLFAACGGKRDMMYDVNNALIAALIADTDDFSYGADPAVNNLFYALSNELHTTELARFYLYNAFDVIFR